MTNQIQLAGKVTRGPEERVLPSGDTVLSFRLSVPRPEGTARPGTDWVDCAVWTARLRRAVRRWQVGDEVVVEGALRRRVFRSGAGVVPLVEVEVRSAQRAVSRADPA